MLGCLGEASGRNRASGGSNYFILGCLGEASRTNPAPGSSNDLTLGSFGYRKSD